MAALRSLADLLPELFDMILDAHGDSNNTHRGSAILNLRLVNRAICSKVDDAFLSTFFTRRRHMYTRESLEALSEMSGQPRLMSKLRYLEIVFWKHGAHLRNDTCGIGSCCDPQNCEWAHEQFEKLDPAEEGVVVLSKIFASLNANGTNVIVAVSGSISTDDENMVPAPGTYIGLAALRRSLQSIMNRSSHVFTLEAKRGVRSKKDRHSQILLQSIAAASYRPAGLDLYINGYGYWEAPLETLAASSRSFVVRDAEAAQLSSLLSSLETFRMACAENSRQLARPTIVSWPGSRSRG